MDSLAISDDERSSLVGQTPESCGGDLVGIDRGQGPTRRGGTPVVDPDHIKRRRISEKITPNTLHQQEYLEGLQDNAMHDSSRVSVETTQACLEWQHGASKLVSDLTLARH